MNHQLAIILGVFVWSFTVSALWADVRDSIRARRSRRFLLRAMGADIRIVGKEGV